MPREKSDYDFCGWASRNDLKCSDGRIIRKDAFKHHDGKRVPLVWNHQHNEPFNILGHADLENRPEGLYAYCTFNDTNQGRDAKEFVKHGDISALSIWANRLKQVGNDVLHGMLREVSLVLAGANPGAFIETVLEHSDGSIDEAIISTGDALEFYHDDTQPVTNDKVKETEPVNKDEQLEHSEDETMQDIFDTLNEKQKNLLFAMVGKAMEGADEANDETNDKEGDKPMKHNVFDEDDQNSTTVLSHAEQRKIIAQAKSTSVGSLRAAIDMYTDGEGELVHGIEQIESLFPEYRNLRPGAPEMLTTDQGWIGRVLAKVHKSPISRIRTRQADVRDIQALRAKGYTKGKLKTEVGNIKLVSRTTDPQTIYVKSKMDRDDVVDIVDFDVVQYLYGIDRMNLNEELARAIMLGDGREDGEDGKISPDHIRPVWTDDELYTIHADVDVETMREELQGTDTATYFGDNYVYAEAVIQTLLYARERYKGSGSPDFLCTPHLLNVMLLARDRNGRRIYDNVNELKAALNVADIITAEQFEGQIRTTTDNKKKKLLGIMYNLADYYLGATKGGEITHFTDFDIDFNQQKSLLETRCSGANTRVLSAIALEEDVTLVAG